MIEAFQDQDIYCDVHPYQETAIWLLGPKKASKNYINASRIQSPYHEGNDHNLLIATQGPKSNTTKNFWRMILQERVGMVVTLCHAIGGADGDCVEYFPTVINEPVKYGSIEVTLLSKAQRGSFIDLRTFSVADSAKSETLKHYHFKGWPDWETPVGKSRRAYEELVDEASEFVMDNARR